MYTYKSLQTRFEHLGILDSDLPAFVYHKENNVGNETDDECFLSRHKIEEYCRQLLNYCLMAAIDIEERTYSVHYTKKENKNRVYLLVTA